MLGDFSLGDQTFLRSLGKGTAECFLRKRLRPDEIDQRLDRPRDPVALFFFHLGRLDVRPVQHQHVGNRCVSAKTPWNRHVELRGHDVGRIVDPQRRFVGVNAGGPIRAISRPKGPQDEVCLIRNGELLQSEDAAPLTSPIS